MAVPNPRPGSGVPGQPPSAPFGPAAVPPVGTPPSAMPGQPFPVPGQQYPMPGQQFPVPGQPYAMPGQPYPVPGQVPQQGFPGAAYPQQPMPGQMPTPGQASMPGGYPAVNQPGPYPQPGFPAPMPGARPAYPSVPQVPPQQAPGFPQFGPPPAAGFPQFPAPAAYQGGVAPQFPGAAPQQFPGAVPPQFPGAVPPQQFPGAPRPQYPGAAPPQFPGAPGAAVPAMPPAALQFPGAMPGSAAPTQPGGGIPGAARPMPGAPSQNPPILQPPAAKGPGSKPQPKPTKQPSPTAPAENNKKPSSAAEPPIRREKPPAPDPAPEAAPRRIREPEIAAHSSATSATSPKPDRLSMAALAAVGAAATQGVPAAALPEEEPVSIGEMLQRNSIPLGVSFVVHFIIILILGLWPVPEIKEDPPTVRASTTPPKPPPRVAAIQGVAGDSKVALDNKPRVALPKLPKIIKPNIKPLSRSPIPVQFTADLPTSNISAALAGRGLKGEMIGKMGGSIVTEEAVETGLAWLARHQGPDGTWSLAGTDPGAAKYPDGCPADAENREAATAMALLAFFGAGHTPASGSPYGAGIDKAVNQLLRLQDSDGKFFHGKRADDLMYTQAMCTMALCEYLALDPSQASRLKAPCERAVKYCIESQDPNLGGWKYAPRRDSDTSVTGWMVMALQSAKNARIDVPKKVFDDITKYFDAAAKGPDIIDSRTVTVVPGQMPPADPSKPPLGSRYSYMPGENHDHVMTAEGLLCRMYLGWSHDDPRLVSGCDFLINEYLPNWIDRDVYYWYYGTQAMFHMEGEYWKKWNGTLRDMLVERQDKQGPQNGSWYPGNTHKAKVKQRDGTEVEMMVGADLWSFTGRGGRLYVTCFSLYMLEVYYRHLPIYSELKKQMEARASTQPPPQEAAPMPPPTETPAMPAGQTPATGAPKVSIPAIPPPAMPAPTPSATKT